MIPLLKDKSYSFAVEIVRLVQYLQQEKKEYVLSKQILKSGTSIGALFMKPFLLKVIRII